MPTYTYRCEACLREADTTHGVNDLLTPACATCGGLMRRVVTTAPVIVKKKMDQAEDVAEDKTGHTQHEDSACVLHQRYNCADHESHSH